MKYRNEEMANTNYFYGKHRWGHYPNPHHHYHRGYWPGYRRRSPLTPGFFFGPTGPGFFFTIGPRRRGPWW